jgi:hypothetical protein
MMETVRTSETSVYSNETTRRYIPEDSKLHTRCRENLKAYISNELRYCLDNLLENDKLIKNYWLCGNYEHVNTDVSF